MAYEFLPITGQLTVEQLQAAFNDRLQDLATALGNGDAIGTDAIDNTHIADNAIDGDMIQYQAVMHEHVMESQIQSAHIQNAAIVTAKIADAAISTAKISDLAVTSAKINDLSASKLTAGTINTDSITVGDAAGKTRISGDTIEVKDGSGNTRAVMGDMYKNGASYGFVSYADDGVTEMFNSTGITAAGIPDRTVVFAALDQTVADATITVGSGLDFEEILDAEHSLPFFIMHDITINVYSGDYSGFIVNPHVGPGMIYIRVYPGETATVGYIHAYNCQCLLNIVNFTATATNRSGFQFWSCLDARLLNCSTTVSAGTQYGIYYANSKGNVSNGTISNRNVGIFAASRSQISLVNVAGTGNDIGTQCTDSVIFMGTDNTITGTAEKATYQGGVITPSGGINFSGSDGAGAWTEWTPTWTGLTLGDGTLVARYQQIGKKVDGYIELTFGSTTSVSGTIYASLPVNAAADARIDGIGASYDSSEGDAPTMYLSLSSNRILFRALRADGTYLRISTTSSSVPFTWDTNDMLMGSFSYETA